MADSFAYQEYKQQHQAAKQRLEQAETEHFRLTLDQIAIKAQDGDDKATKDQLAKQKKVVEALQAEVAKHPAPEFAVGPAGPVGP